MNSLAKQTGVIAIIESLALMMRASKFFWTDFSTHDLVPFFV